MQKYDKLHSFPWIFNVGPNSFNIIKCPTKTKLAIHKMHRFCKVLGHDYCLLAELCGGNIPLKRWKHTRGYCLKNTLIEKHTDPNENIWATQPARLVVLKSLKLLGFSIDLCSTIDKYRSFQPNFVVRKVL